MYQMWEFIYYIIYCGIKCSIALWSVDVSISVFMIRMVISHSDGSVNGELTEQNLTFSTVYDVTIFS